jgi:hypothetical protein
MFGVSAIISSTKPQRSLAARGIYHGERTEGSLQLSGLESLLDEVGNLSRRHQVREIVIEHQVIAAKLREIR